MATERIELEVGDRVVKISNPDRVYFSARGETKLDLAQYYLSVADGIVNALYHRPCMLHRFPDGVDGEKVHQKRLPHGAPPWIETVRVHFPRYNRDADELCVTHPADVIWAVQMSTVEFHPWNSRRDDVESPDEWRIDLDPMPVASYADVRRVSVIVQELLAELGAVGYPKTSGGKGLHVYVRIVPDHGHPDVRRAAWAFAREVERRADGLVDLTWWRKDRDPGSVFVDYNQNARDHTIASAYSVRGTPLGHRLGAGALGRDRRRRPAGLHHRHHAGPVRRARRPARRHRRPPLPAGHPPGVGRPRRTSVTAPGHDAYRTSAPRSKLR